MRLRLKLRRQLRLKLGLGLKHVEHVFALGRHEAAAPDMSPIKGHTARLVAEEIRRRAAALVLERLEVPVRGSERERGERIWGQT